MRPTVTFLSKCIQFLIQGKQDTIGARPRGSLYDWAAHWNCYFLIYRY